MSIFINSKVHLPSSCEKCPFNYADMSAGVCTAVDKTIDTRTYGRKRHPDCPLTELPTPHGRLIDADQLQTAIHGLLCENCVTFSCEKGIGCLIEDVFNLIDEAPAVIEAEHESEAQKWARVGRDISKGLQEGIEAIDSEGIEE